MVTPLSGTPPAAAEVQAAPARPPASSSASNRATAPDTVSISDAGRQLSQAAQSLDHDGDNT